MPVQKNKRRKENVEMGVKIINNWDVEMTADKIKDIYLEHTYNVEEENIYIRANLGKGVSCLIGHLRRGRYISENENIEKMIKKYRISLKLIAEMYISFLEYEIIKLSGNGEINTKNRYIIDKNNKKLDLNIELCKYI